MHDHINEKEWRNLSKQEIDDLSADLLVSLSSKLQTWREIRKKLNIHNSVKEQQYISILNSLINRKIIRETKIENTTLYYVII